jgi:hypothetical protein
MQTMLASILTLTTLVRVLKLGLLVTAWLVLGYVVAVVLGVVLLLWVLSVAAPDYG